MCEKLNPIEKEQSSLLLLYLLCAFTADRRVSAWAARPRLSTDWSARQEEGCQSPVISSACHRHAHELDVASRPCNDCCYSCLAALRWFKGNRMLGWRPSSMTWTDATVLQSVVGMAGCASGAEKISASLRKLTRSLYCSEDSDHLVGDGLMDHWGCLTILRMPNKTGDRVSKGKHIRRRLWWLSEQIRSK